MTCINYITQCIPSIIAYHSYDLIIMTIMTKEKNKEKLCTKQINDCTIEINDDKIQIYQIM